VGASQGFSNTFFTQAYPLVPVRYPGLKDPFCFSSLAARGSSRAALNCPDFYNFISTLALSKLVRLVKIDSKLGVHSSMTLCLMDRSMFWFSSSLSAKVNFG
jgi:hypothetical protein